MLTIGTKVNNILLSKVPTCLQEHELRRTGRRHLLTKDRLLLNNYYSDIFTQSEIFKGFRYMWKPPCKIYIIRLVCSPLDQF